ncbi:acyltransferase family protein [Maricaulis sp.]|jgi:peptidoglycan/LPS O-acetylase OafA/YrhL|uniref:acyltransferase family protein n=1 Tax=Maricaulis sp. TaxID=1486257 RepID=UPI0026175360|nr:acyltransferase family protein [Maricaulis sp.]
MSSTRTLRADAGQTGRLHALDGLRAIALLLGVVLHAAMSFIPGPPIWIIQDSQAATPFALAFYVPHIFRMTLFFLIAGYFARLAAHRRGLGGFAIDRVKRIGMPLVTLWLPLFAAIVMVVIWGAIKANGGTPPDGETPPLTMQTFPLTHLWFLYLLVIFYAVSLPLTALVRAIDRSDRTGRLIDAATGLLARTPFGAVLLAAPLAVWFAITPVWMQWFGIATPDTGLVPNTGALIGYGTAFAAGWAVHRRSDLVLNCWKRAWPINLAAAGTLTALCLAWTGVQPLLMPAEPGQDRILYAGAYTLAIWTWTFGLSGAALHVLARENRVWRYLADSSYWVYLMHLPLVMALQVALSDLALPGLAKLAIILAVTMALLLASYHLLVRHSWVGGWLNGKRHPRRRDTPPATAQAGNAA